MNTPSWVYDTAIWFKALLAAFIGGAATAGVQWLGILTAKGAGLEVPVLNWKSLGIMMLVAGAGSALMYLKTSPVPVSVTKTTIEVTKETNQGP